jgi:hypothetical protein
MIFEYYKQYMIALLAVSIFPGDFWLVGASKSGGGKIFWPVDDKGKNGEI